MCDFISWIEYENEIYFLKSSDLKTKEGRDLRLYLKDQFDEDIKGHGAIDRYYGLKGKGTHKECTDFSSPDNFPSVIVAAIKAGHFCGIDISESLLTGQAWAEYKKVKGQAWAEYEKVAGQALAEYEKVKEQAVAEYEKVKGQELAEYEKVTGPAWAEYRKVARQALAEYKKVTGPALAEYKKVKGPAFWKIFLVVKNRAKAWR